MSMTKVSKIILASNSLQRKLMMDSLGFEYEIISSFINEGKIEETDPRKRAVKLAQLKALDVATRYPTAMVIAADTFGVLEAQILEKPKSKAEAAKMLELMSGRWLTALTGVAFESLKIKEQKSKLFETIFKFRELSAGEIKRYVSEQPVTAWSAGFCPGYPAGAALIEKVDGDLTSFLYGLPVPWVAQQLRLSGIEF